jgi:hypothetical protein
MILPKLTDDFYSIVSQWLHKIRSIFDLPDTAKVHMRFDSGDVLIAIQVLPMEEMDVALDWTNTDSFLLIPANSENIYVCIKFNHLLAEMYEEAMAAAG